MRLWQRSTPSFGAVDAPRPDLLPSVHVLEVADARVTPFVRKRAERRGFWTTEGAVHRADGTLLEASLRTGGLSGDQVRAADVGRHLAEPSRVLEGRWLYIGNWMKHFGHFLTETLTTLWADVGDVDGVLAHPFIQRDREPSAPELALYHAAGLTIPPTLVEAELRVDRLVVPTRPFVPNAGAAPEATIPWTRIAGRFGADGTPTRLFLSRSAFHAAHAARDGTAHPRAFANDRAVDELMQAHGFAVIHPENIGIEDQVRLAAGAEVIAGPSGTALHLAAFARPDTRVLELGDPRSPHGLPNQQAIAAVKGQAYAAVPLPTSDKGGSRSVQVRQLARSLRLLGLG